MALRGAAFWCPQGRGGEERVMEHWKGLPRVEVESPSQEIFKRYVGMA